MCVYVCPEAMETVAELIDECAAIGVRDVGRVMLKLLNENAFVSSGCETSRPTRRREWARRARRCTRISTKRRRYTRRWDTCCKVISPRSCDRWRRARASTRAPAVATADDTGAGAPVMICSTVDTLLTKTRTKRGKGAARTDRRGGGVEALPSLKIGNR